MRCNYKKGKVLRYNAPISRNDKRSIKESKKKDSYKNICEYMGIPNYDPKEHGKSFFKYLKNYFFKKIDEESK